MPKKITTNKKELYDPSEDPEIKEYQEEAEKRWGSTEAYKQSIKRIGKMTKLQMDKLKKDSIEFTKKLASAMDKDIKNKEVQDLIAEHYKGIQFFYDCPLEMYRNLGQMYVDDPRFTAYYDRHRPGLAVFVRDAIAYFCNENGK